ncbi:hypothetical protein HK099_007972 [Clydaea vesicula]|uniref:C2H2-type domain-containing protein n=1 Tax=Clydaea vesicula TaxID=447962 RepID=A0AAD5XW34_9FUNG|nr:hypothetical protein HK099_007972 [Clydaea vesicula]
MNCKYCSQQFEKKSQIDSHYRLFHQDKVRVAVNLGPNATAFSEVTRSNNRFNCEAPECDYSHENPNAFGKHCRKCEKLKPWLETGRNAVSINVVSVDTEVRENTNSSSSNEIIIETEENNVEVTLMDTSRNSQGDNDKSDTGTLYENEEEFKQEGILKRLNLGINNIYHFLIDVEENNVLHFTKIDGFKRFIYKRASKVQVKKKEAFIEVKSSLNARVIGNTIGDIDDPGLLLLLPAATGNLEFSMGENNFELVKPIAGLKVYDGFRCVSCCSDSANNRRKPFYCGSESSMKQHMKTIHKNPNLQYSFCKVQKAFSNNQNPYKKILKSYFGVQILAVQNNVDNQATRFSIVQLKRSILKLTGLSGFTERQSDVTAMHSNSKFFEITNFQDEFDSWPLKNLFFFVDKDVDVVQKQLIEKIVGAYYKKGDAALSFVSFAVKSDLMKLSKRQNTDIFHSLPQEEMKIRYQKFFADFIVFCVRVQKKSSENSLQSDEETISRELGTFFFNALDENSKNELKAFTLKLQELEEKIEESAIEANLYLKTNYGVLLFNALISSVHELHLLLMQQEFHIYKYQFQDSIHCLFLMCRCVKINLEKETDSEPSYRIKYTVNFTNQIAILQYFMRITVVFELDKETKDKVPNIQYEYFLSLVNEEFKNINGKIKKTSFSFLDELMEIASRHPPVGHNGLLFKPVNNRNVVYYSKFDVTYSISSLQKGVSLAFKEVESNFDALLMDFVPNNELKIEKIREDCDSQTPGYSFLTDSRNGVAKEEKLRYTWHILQKLLTSSSFVTFQNSNDIRDLELKVADTNSFLKSCNTFLDTLLFLIHILSGQPLRGTELLSIMICNSFDSIRRSIIWILGEAVLVTTDYKNYAINEKPSYNYQRLDAKTSSFLFKYLLYIRPTLHTIASLRSSALQNLNNLRSFLFTFSNGDRYNKTNINEIYCEGFKKFIYTHIDFSTNRQLMIYFAKVNAISLGNEERNIRDNVAYEQIEDQGFDTQANYAARTANNNYGRGRPDPFNEIVGIDDYTRGLAYSSKWQKLLINNTSIIPAIHSNTVNSSIDTISTIPTQPIVNMYSYNYFTHSAPVAKRRKFFNVPFHTEGSLSLFDIYNQLEEEENSEVDSDLDFYDF